MPARGEQDAFEVSPGSFPTRPPYPSASPASSHALPTKGEGGDAPRLLVLGLAATSSPCGSFTPLRSLLPRTSPLQGLPRFRGCKQPIPPSPALPYSPVLESSPPPTRCCLLPEITSFTGAGIWFAWFFTPFPGSVIVPGTYLLANKYLLSDPPPELSRGRALSAGGER